MIDWVITSAHDAAEEFGITVRLIASVNRHESHELAEQVAWLAAEQKDRGLIAMDLAGNEAEFKSEPFYSVFKEARQAGLHITIHAGEWGPAANVKEAIEELGANASVTVCACSKIDNVVALAKERNTAFEVCVTSNYQSGVVPALEAHPLGAMLKAGLNVTINTDDPSISRITLSQEYHIVCEELGLIDGHTQGTNYCRGSGGISIRR